ncbi:isopenicillin N synthase-like dioxygenase [Novosphingobium chloroacetimidivorans]|uniref:2-oxoglutarate-dependent ethylene/succinate-forming enzyme n=1 Tax=Novosphingobium chloroacetimidivorans TaxID=1428314 RepID=A0A7W7KAF0_9SPHN|nr:isopenicillin N synthase family oxygenase [Novosphingobium chloroacetimidivorans]MBB4858568.1 isopenicillin N synthase-like dioxygenase [Novosphingobium chloroacetimidivorans]
MDIAEIPILSLAEEPRALSTEIGRSFRTFGFALVRDHGIDLALIDEAWRLTAELFAQPTEQKMRGFIPGTGGARGYTPFRTEVAKGATEKDLKEFWHVGRDLPAGHPLSATMAPNVWPEQPKAFREVFETLYVEFDRAGARILSAIALDLGLDEHWFDAAVEDGNSVLRLLHYPPVGPESGGAIRAGAHEDINLITLLLGAEEAGLELLGKDGRWLSIAPPPGALVVNIGDMLQRLTNHVLPSTTHRVRNPSGERAGYSRYSMPFFLHPRSDFEIRTLPECVSADNPDRYPESITADGYLQERLREIGLKG